MPEANDFDPDSYDNFIGAQVILPKYNQYLLETIMGRKHDVHGYPVGKYNNNPIFDAHIYQVKLHDGHTDEFSENVKAECLYSQVDDKADKICSLMRSLITRCPGGPMMKITYFKYHTMATYTQGELPKAGTYAFIGRMGPHHGSH
jgi:hypothetical protein